MKDVIQLNTMYSLPDGWRCSAILVGDTSILGQNALPLFYQCGFFNSLALVVSAFCVGNGLPVSGKKEIPRWIARWDFFRFSVLVSGTFAVWSKPVPCQESGQCSALPSARQSYPYMPAGKRHTVLFSPQAGRHTTQKVPSSLESLCRPVR